MRFRTRIYVNLGLSLAIAVVTIANGASAQSPSPHRLRADLQFLSANLLEGRAAGTRGDVLAAEYLRTRLAGLGFKVNFQAVPLIGIETQRSTRIGSFTWLTDVAGFTGNLQRENNFQFTDVVFAGHGIDAPEFKWDDYSDLVVRGKIVVLIAGEPTSDEAAFFSGAKSTPYATPEYKFAEASRRGALAVFIIHTPETAGFGWDTVQRQWGTERVLAARPERTNPASGMQFEGWVSKAASAKWLETDIDALIVESNKPGFRARRLDKRMAGRITTNIRTFSTRNVIAVAPGADPKLTREAVLFTAHLDHLGMAAVSDAARASGNTIYNGAIDNATGLASLLEIARLWAEIDPAPNRSAIFLATGAGEMGARGAEAYAAAPAMPLAATKVAINLHEYLPLGRTRDFIFSGIETSPTWPVIRETVNRLGFDIKYFPSDDNADTGVFTRAGVTAFTLRPGPDYSSEPARKATLVEEYFATQHHRPGDEYRDDWDISGLEQVTRLGLEIGLAVANAPGARPPPVPAK